jgi:hypothetical protein
MSERPDPAQSVSPVEISDDERRRERRVPAQGEGEIMWVDKDARRHSYAVSLNDISPGGRGVLVQQAVPVGQSLVVVFGDGIPSWGVTRYCRPVEGGYQVGIQLPRETERR